MPLGQVLSEHYSLGGRTRSDRLGVSPCVHLPSGDIKVSGPPSRYTNT